MRRISAEEKLLRQVAKVMMVDNKYPARQEPPFCTRCNLAIDVADPLIRVNIHDIDGGGKMLLIAEPYCPGCGSKIKAVVNTIH